MAFGKRVPFYSTQIYGNGVHDCEENVSNSGTINADSHNNAFVARYGMSTLRIQA